MQFNNLHKAFEVTSDKELLFLLRDEMRSCEAVGDYLHCSKDTIYNLLRKWDYPFDKSSNNRGKGVFIAKLAEFKKEHTDEQIAEMTKAEILRVMKYEYFSGCVLLTYHEVECKSRRIKKGK